MITFYFENNHYNNYIGRFLYGWLNIKTIGVKMLGAIIGDLVGSRLEFNNFKLKDFNFFDEDCFYTDDTVMTLAIAKALLSASDDFSNLEKLSIKYMQKYGRKYAIWEYGIMFSEWLAIENPQPYNSYGNGAAMRISPVGWVATSLGEVKRLSYLVTKVSHNHPEGIKGAEAVASAIYLARTGTSKEEIKQYIIRNYYQINFTLDEIRPTYSFDQTCPGSVPEAFQAFFESSSFEDALRNAISLGGDSDTIGAITGSITEAYYGVTTEYEEKTLTYLDDELQKIYQAFKVKYL